jgi:exodeoxyribonuclease VII small subunit
MRFKEGLDRLETVVESLERGELELEDALGAYEEGVRLYRRLLEILSGAERRIEELAGQKDGALLWKKFQGLRAEEETKDDGATT